MRKKNLKIGDILAINGVDYIVGFSKINGDILYHILPNVVGKINRIGKTNELYKKLGVQITELQQKTLGYTNIKNNPIFPHCKTLSDLSKFVTAIQKQLRLNDLKKHNTEEEKIVKKTIKKGLGKTIKSSQIEQVSKEISELKVAINNIWNQYLQFENVMIKHIKDSDLKSETQLNIIPQSTCCESKIELTKNEYRTIEFAGRFYPQIKIKKFSFIKFKKVDIWKDIELNIDGFNTLEQSNDFIKLYDSIDLETIIHEYK